MKAFVSFCCSLACLVSNACAMSALFSVFSSVEGMDKGDAALGLWLCCISLCHLCLGLVSRRGTSERGLISVCAGFFAAQLVLSFVLYGIFSGFVGMLIAVAMWLYSYFNCFELNMNGPQADKLSKGFDLACLVLVFTLFFCSVKGLSLRMVLPLLLSCAFILLALALIRGGEQRKLRSALMSGGLVLGFGALAAAFVAVASGGIRHLLAALSSMAQTVLGFVFKCIDGLFRFIMGLFPQKEYDTLVPELAETAQYGEISDMSFELIDPRIFLGIVFALAFLVAAALVLHRFIKGGSIVKHSGKISPCSVKNRGIAAKLLQRLRARLRFFLRRLTARGTSPGLLLEIERRSRSKLHGRGESESCREFLGRAVEVYPHAVKELDILADTLDAIFFGPGEDLSKPELSRLRRVIFAENDK